jgi:hypothetical protein
LPDEIAQQPCGETRRVNPPDISVVICTYNREKMLRLALDALLRQETDGNFSYEVVVIDDASTDGTADVVAELERLHADQLRYVRGQGRGVAEARNLGVESARGTWVAFTDDDQLNDPRWLAELHALAQRTGAECVGGSVHLKFETEPAFPLTLVTQSILGYKVHPEGRITRLMDCPGTGNVMIHRKVFARVGRFDPTLDWGGEDAEFMLRVMQAGIPVWFTPKSVVHHMIPPYRVTVEYYRWASLRVGVALAEVDGKVRGRARLALICTARVAQAALINAPRLWLARLTGDAGQVLERRCRLWRVTTYARQTLHCLAPGLFPQRRFFEGLKFRGERNTVAKKKAGPR